MWTALQFIGAALVVAGVALLSIPAAFIAGGVIAFVVGLIGDV